jgi:hypothetical protein
VDTVGQAPAVQSPFSQQAAAATNPLAAPIDLSAVRQAPMLGGFEVKGAGAERFDVGTPEVPETLFSKEYTDPGGNTAAIARIEGERARANAVEASTPVDSRGFFEKFADATRSDPAPQVGGGISPFGGGTAMRTTAEGASGAVVDAIQSAIPMGLPGALPFEGTPSPATPAVAAPEVMGTPESIADLSVNGTDVVTPEAITEAAPAAPQAQLPSTIQNAGGQNLAGFKPKYEGQSLTDFMAGRDDPSAASVQVQDPQGRFRRQAASVEGETPEQNQSRTDALFPEQADFEQASADREARQAARPDFGEAVSDRDRRAARGEGISDADRRDIAKAQSPNASASDRARGMKVAEKAGLDWRTGQPLKQEKETGGLTDYQAITAQQRQTEIDLKIADGMEEKEAKRAVAYEESRSNVRSTQDSFDKLRPVAEEIALLSGSKFTEGALGWTASKLPFSTDAAQIERLTTEFEGSAFLQGLIDAKAKGATFGALSEREGDRILGQWGKITSPKSKNPERIRAVNSMLESIQRSSERATSDHKEKFPDRSASSSKAQAQGSPEGKRHAKDQDHGAKVDTHFQT